MLRRIALLAFVLIAGCTGTRGGPAVRVDVSVSPRPLHVGTAKITALVRDPRDGKPIDDAQVVVLTSMPAMRMQQQMPMSSMGHTGETLTARSEGHGTYTAMARITEATLWSIVVHARSAAGEATWQMSERAGAAKK